MKVLAIIDAQYDFMIKGSLAVPGGEEIVPYINKLLFSGRFNKIITTQDYHPINHTSFAKNHGVEDYAMVNGERKWPVHCVEGTLGAQINNAILIPLEITSTIKKFLKGKHADLEQYSGYGSKWELNEDDEVTIVGLATDYCVSSTAIDAFKLSKCKKITVDLAGCRGVEKESSDKAIEEMKALGIKIING